MTRGRRCVGSENRQTPQQPAQPPVRQLLGTADAQTAHPATFSTAPTHQRRGSATDEKRHQQEHRPQRPTERSDPTQHAKGRTGDCPGPRKGATTRRNVTRGGRTRPPLQGALGQGGSRWKADSPLRREGVLDWDPLQNRRRRGSERRGGAVWPRGLGD